MSHCQTSQDTLRSCVNAPKDQSCFGISSAYMHLKRLLRRGRAVSWPLEKFFIEIQIKTPLFQMSRLESMAELQWWVEVLGATEVTAECHWYGWQTASCAAQHKALVKGHSWDWQGVYVFIEYLFQVPLIDILMYFFRILEPFSSKTIHSFQIEIKQLPVTVRLQFIKASQRNSCHF